jgi:hypothetical protein
MGISVSEEHIAAIFRTVYNDIFISPPLEPTATHTTGAGDDENERTIDSLEMKTLNDNFQPSAQICDSTASFLDTSKHQPAPACRLQPSRLTSVNDNQPG